jgi:hypothetical protein
MGRTDRSIDALGVDQLLAVLKALKHQLNATKRVYFSHSRGRDGFKGTERTGCCSGWRGRWRGGRPAPGLEFRRVRSRISALQDSDFAGRPGLVNWQMSRPSALRRECLWLPGAGQRADRGFKLRGAPALCSRGNGASTARLRGAPSRSAAYRFRKLRTHHVSSARAPRRSPVRGDRRPGASGFGVPLRHRHSLGQ